MTGPVNRLDLIDGGHDELIFGSLALGAGGFLLKDGGGT